MILRSLRLQNYRGFASQTFPFSNRVTVIAGINGRGKSSILDATALLLSNLLPKVTPAIGGYKYLSDSDIKLGADRMELGIQASFEGIPVEFSISKDAGERQIPTTILRQVREEILRVYGDPNNVTDSAPIAVYYTTDRASYRLPKKLLALVPVKQAAAYRGALVNRQIDYRDFMSRFLTWRELPTKRSKATVALIQRVVRQFLPGISRIRVKEDAVRLTVQKGDEILDLTQLSDGERSILAILMDLCRRLNLANPGLRDPSQGKGVVLIDEIELHLHPKWQREIIDKFREAFPNLQFIFTTHSPFVVQTLRDGELRLLGGDLSDDEAITDPGDYSNRGLEEVVTKVMGIDDPNIVPRYTRMLDAAKEYYRRLEMIDLSDPEKVARLSAELDGLIAPFSDDPAYKAFLDVQRAAAFRAGEATSDTMT